MTDTETTHAAAPLPTMAEVVDGIRAGRYELELEFQDEVPPAEFAARVHEMAELASRLVARAMAPRLSAALGRPVVSLDDVARINKDGVPEGHLEHAGMILTEWRLADEQVRRRAMWPLRMWYETSGFRCMVKAKKKAGGEQ